MKAISNLKDLLVEELYQCYYSEKQQLKTFPGMVQHCQSPRIQQAIQQGLARKRENKFDLEFILKELREDPTQSEEKRRTSLKVKTRKLTEKDFEPDVLDAAIITLFLQVNRHDYSNYEAAFSYAMALGFKDIASRIHTNLVFQKSMNHNLTGVVKETMTQLASNEVFAYYQA